MKTYQWIITVILLICLFFGSYFTFKYFADKVIHEAILNTQEDNYASRDNQ